MKRTFSLLVMMAACLSAQAPKSVSPKAGSPSAKPAASVKLSALDKKQFESYVRHLFVWPEPIEIHIDDPGPSTIPGFYQVRVHATQGKASQEELFFVSKDGKQIIRGTVYAIAENPFHDQLTKLKTKDHPSFGTPGAPVVLVEFSDFQCHYCREEAKVFRDNLLKVYPREVRFYFMDFPLETMHPWSLAGAIAGRCVYRQSEDAFWNFHDWIFEHQEEITPETLHDKVLDWAKGSKELDGTKLGTCMDSRATEPDVRATLTMGKALAVGSTPTTFINGRPLIGSTPWEEAKRVIDFELQYQQTAKNAGEACGCDLGIPKSGVK